MEQSSSSSVCALTSSSAVKNLGPEILNWWHAAADGRALPRLPLPTVQAALPPVPWFCAVAAGFAGPVGGPSLLRLRL